MITPQRAGIATELFSQVESRVTGPPRMILVRDRRSEQRHDAVARVLIDRAFEAVNSVRKDREETIHNLVPLFRVDLFGKVHRALHVGEEDGHLLALAFESGARREDLLGEVLRRVGPGLACGLR